MSEELNRIQLDENVTYKLRSLSRNFEMTPNYIARIGLTYSLSADRPPSLAEYDQKGKEFNRYTLLGEHDTLYITLVKKRMLNENFDPDEELEDYFLAHLNRGIETLSGSVSGIEDLHTLIPQKLLVSDDKPETE